MPVEGARIAVEAGLEDMHHHLVREGFTVTPIPAVGGDLPRNVDCVVIRGGDVNVMGQQGRTVSVPVIDASGMDPRQVADEVRRRLEVIGGS